MCGRSSIGNTLLWPKAPRVAASRGRLEGCRAGNGGIRNHPGASLKAFAAVATTIRSARGLAAPTAPGTPAAVTLVGGTTGIDCAQPAGLAPACPRMPPAWGARRLHAEQGAISCLDCIALG